MLADNANQMYWCLNVLKCEWHDNMTVQPSNIYYRASLWYDLSEKKEKSVDTLVLAL